MVILENLGKVILEDNLVCKGETTLSKLVFDSTHVQSSKLYLFSARKRIDC